jgi:hypothetical protein
MGQLVTIGSTTIASRQGTKEYSSSPRYWFIIVSLEYHTCSKQSLIKLLECTNWIHQLD